MVAAGNADWQRVLERELVRSGLERALLSEQCDLIPQSFAASAVGRGGDVAVRDFGLLDPRDELRAADRYSNRCVNSRALVDIASGFNVVEMTTDR